MGKGGMATPRLRIIPLGGLGEIGKNMMVVEYGEDILVIDAGIMFPEDEMLGVDLVLPDTTYLEERADRIRGILITHGHEDHTGALPYVLRQLKLPPIYATQLTHGLIAAKLREHRLLDQVQQVVVHDRDSVQLGCFEVEFFAVCHSIPDGVGLAIHTPVGTVVHTGDFKFDQTPVDGRLTDFPRLAALGGEGVLLLLSDSTRVEVPGYTLSEKVVGEAFDQIFAQAPGRIIVATFASLISRVQLVIDAAARLNRRVGFVGRSMEQNTTMALAQGYLRADPDQLVRTEDLNKVPHEQLVIVTTGAQGEPTSALTRMANRDHRQISIVPGDTIILSSSPIPGNEGAVARTIDNLFKQGAQVYYQTTHRVHVSGHASQEELKLMIGLLRPQFFIPIHGEFRHLQLHAELARSMGMAPSQAFAIEDGDVLEFTADSVERAGRVSAGYVFVDGLSVGDVGTVVLRDRQLLAKDGMFVAIVTVDKQTGKVIGRPDIVSRGFVYLRQAEELMEQARDLIVETLESEIEHPADWAFIKTAIKDELSRFLYEETRRRPMVLPVVMEV